MGKIIFAVILTFFFIGCNNKDNQNFTISTKNGIFVINEGNFTYSNASLSFFRLDEDTAYNDIFFKTNDFPIGDVAQSGIILDTNLWIVVNNSGKIFILNKDNCKYVNQITGLTSPRYILPVSDDLAYVSDLYSEFITVINTKNFQKITTINVGVSTEQMVKFQDYVYVCNWSYGNKILKINSLNHTLTDSISVAYQPNSLVIDKNGFLWILSDGGNDPDTNKNFLPALTKINLTNFSIDTVFYFSSKALSPNHLQIDDKKENLYFLSGSWANISENGGIFKMNISDNKLPQTPIIKETDHLFYSFKILTNGYIAVSDAIDYLQRGEVLIFDENGIFLKKYKVGIIPSFFIENN